MISERKPPHPGPRRPRAALKTSGTESPFFTTLLLLALASGLGCGSGTPPVPPPNVTVANPTRQSVTEYLEFTGTTAATDSVTLVARVEGYLEERHFEDGSEVKKGAPLFSIQQGQYKAQLQQAAAQLAAQQAALLHANTELARYTVLVKEDSAPQTEVDQWTFQKESAQAGILGAEAQIELAKLNLAYTKITAPFDGRMDRHLVDPGNVVGGMAQPTSLAQIDKIDPLYVYFTVNERDLLGIRAEHKGRALGSVEKKLIPAFFGLLDEKGYPQQGHLDFAALSVSATTGTLQARAIFANPAPGILPGLFVRVRVPSAAPHDALLIPGEAVAFDQQGEYVLVVGNENVVERRTIETGSMQGRNIVVENGLALSDQVIVAGIVRAIPGRKVMPARAPQPTSTAAPAAQPQH